MRKIAVVALLSAVVALPAYADSGPYAGLKVGGTKVGFSGLTKSSDTAFGALLGYQYSSNFAVEGEYADLGRFSGAGVSGKSDVWGLSAVGILPLEERFSVFGKLGVSRSGTRTSTASGVNRTAATYGLGGQFDATPMIGLRFTWERYRVGVVGQNADDDLYSLAAMFKF